MRKERKRFLSLVLALVMLLTMYSIPVFADENLMLTKGSIEVGRAPATQDPGILSYSEPGATKDWVAGDHYYYIENDFAKYIIGTTSHPQVPDYSKTGIGKQGGLVEGTVVDAFFKGMPRENLDYSELVLVKSDHPDLRNWFYYQYKLRFPDITADSESGTIIARGGWDYDEGIKSSVVYSMLDNAPFLKMEVTLTNTNESPFHGRIGYIIDANEGTNNARDRATYIPGVGWKTTDAASGTQLTSGWTEGFVYIGQKDIYTGYTGHAVLWNESEQPAVAVIPKFTYTGAWFDVNLPANGGTQTITIYHLAEVPANKDEPYAAAALWAKAIREGREDRLAVVAGRVTDKAGNKISGATVKVTSGDNVYTATTNGEGFYYIWVERGDDCWISASYDGMAEFEKQLKFSDKLTIVDFILSSTAVGKMPVGKDPNFSGYEDDCKNWVDSDHYYYIKNKLATYLIEPEDTSDFIAPGSIIDAVPSFNGFENLYRTEFIITNSVNGRWFNPKGTPSQKMLRLDDISVDESSATITARGYWDQNKNNSKDLNVSVNYSMVENSPLLKMDITIKNDGRNSYKGYFGYAFDKEGSDEEFTYIPGLGWYPYSRSNEHITSGWNGNYLFSGRETGYSGKTAHAIIWPEDQQPYGMINNGAYTGVDYELELASGESTMFTLYHMAHVPGAEAEPYASAALWADAVKNNRLDRIAAINGLVTDSVTGEAIEGALVSYTADGRTFTAVTDSLGRYQLFVPKDMQYEITCEKASYIMETINSYVSEYNTKHMLSMQSTDRALEVELPDSRTAKAEVTAEKPEFIYPTKDSDSWEKGDLLLEDIETAVVVDKLTGVLKDAVPKKTGIDDISSAELVLTAAPDEEAKHPGKNFDILSVAEEENRIVVKAVAQDNSNVDAMISYSMVENSPLVKVKVLLSNKGNSVYSGSFGYIFDPVANGEQTYIPGSGWIGGGPGGYAKALKTPDPTENYIFNGSLGKRTNNTAHSIIWSDYFKPSNLIWSGDWLGLWYDVSLDAKGKQEIIFYHFAHTPGDKESPLDATQFWANIVKKGIDPSTVARITGVASKGGSPSSGIKITASSGDHAYTTATIEDGTYTIYGIVGREYTLTASNGIITTDEKTIRLAEGGSRVDFDIAEADRSAVAGMTYGNPEYVYNPGAGLRDWWPTIPYYYLENDFTKISIDTRRISKLTSARPSEDSNVWSNDNSGNGKWGGLNSGTIVDAVSKQNMTENLDWSAFVLFSTRPSDPSHPDYYNRNYLGVTDEDEAVPNEMYMEWSWWFPMNKLELNNITTDGETITASGIWDGGIDRREDILASVKYSMVRNSPLVKMDITLINIGYEEFDGQFAFLLDPDMEGEQHSYVPGYGWEYSQVKKRISGGWTDNYIFDGYNGFSGNTAHAIIWPDDQQPMLVFSEAGWISAWFKTNIPAGGEDKLTIYYLPHTPGGSDAPYAIAEYWARFIERGTDPSNQAAIRGTITDKSGKAIPNVEVSLISENNTYMRVVTDANGKYTLFAEAGDYTLEAYNPEYELVSKGFTLNGGDLLVEDIIMVKYVDSEIIFPENISRGETFEFTVKVSNESESSIDLVNIDIITPSAVKLVSEPNIVINNLDVGEERTYKFEALAVYGGREVIKVKLSNADFQMTKGFALDISGFGWYGGDNHSHSNNSDGVDTIAENVSSAYNRWNLSWLMNTDHNTDAQAAEAAAETAKMAGKFVSISAVEITTGYTHKPTTPSGTARGHALAYGYDGVPTLIITEEGGSFDWQDSINQVLDAGGLFYIAHPFDRNYAFENVYSWRGFTGVEVWNGSWHASHSNNQKAFEFWDKINIRGDSKYYGIAGTDGHNAQKIGDTYVRGLLYELSEDNVLKLLGSGQYYGTNGPDLRFSINGVAMGNTLTIKEAGEVSISFEAFSKDGNLTNVKVLGYPITGKVDDYDKGIVVFEKDLSNENTDYYSASISTKITQNMFFRLEVKSENCTPGSVGSGPETGTGFAYSNPVWVEIGSEDTSLDIKRIAYDGKPLTVEMDGFDRKILYVDAETFDVEKLEIIGNGMITKRFIPATVSRGNIAGLLDIVVSVSDSHKTTHSYVVCYRLQE